MEGWIKLHRKIMEWEWYDDANTKSLFLHLLLSANHEEKRYRGIVVGRGQVITGLSKLAAETNMSVQQTRTCISRLKSTNEITTKSTNKGTIITIIKWGDYQCCDENATSKITNKPTNEQQTNNKQITTNNKYKEYKEYKEYKNIYIAPSDEESSLGAVYRMPLISNINEGIYRYWLIFEDKIKEYELLFPNVDVEQEIRNMVSWCDSNPSKRKTPKGAPRFINSWLERKQNRNSIPTQSKGGGMFL